MSDETPVEPLPGPLDEAPYVRLSDAEAMLRAAVAGIELGAYDEVILDWMLTWDQPTLATIASIIRRVGERGPITPEDR